MAKSHVFSWNDRYGRDTLVHAKRMEYSANKTSSFHDHDLFMNALW